jgi:hypothetical protein
MNSVGLEHCDINSFYEIVERLKDVISQKYRRRAVLDKFVADELGMKYHTFRMYKYKNILPMKELISFCCREKISLDWLLYDKDFRIKRLECI